MSAAEPPAAADPARVPASWEAWLSGAGRAAEPGRTAGHAFIVAGAEGSRDAPGRYGGHLSSSWNVIARRPQGISRVSGPNKRT
jgi:hypothetical protein